MVPTLRGPDLLLTDSSVILRYAASQVGDGWLDADPRLNPASQEAVAGQHALSIETLTFSEPLVSRPWMQPVVRWVLAGLNRSLETRAELASDGGAALRAKAQKRPRPPHHVHLSGTRADTGGEARPGAP